MTGPAGVPMAKLLTNHEAQLHRSYTATFHELALTACTCYSCIMSKQTEFTVLTGTSFTVVAASAEEALAKFYVSQGYEDPEDYNGLGYDFTTVDEDVTESEVLTEVI